MTAITATRMLVSSAVLACLAAPAFAQNGFVFSEWSPASPATEGYEQFLAGDFTGDGLTDVLGYDPVTGSLEVGTNTGAGFAFATWSIVAPESEWQFATGDFDGDGALDVLGYYGNNGTSWMGRNTGSGFSFTLWQTFVPLPLQIYAGDFTGDGRDDGGAYYAPSGYLGVSRNQGSSFEAPVLWTEVSPRAGWQFVAGSFTGDAITDLAGYHPSNGSLWVGESLGSTFSFTQWGEIQSSGWVATRLAAGDVDGDADTDLILYDTAEGVLVGSNDATTFSVTPRASAPGPFSGFAAGSFTGSPLVDVVGYDAPTGRIWVGENVPACANGADDDGDGLADVADPGCIDSADDTETNDSQPCDDGIDNDADGLVDDTQDPGCFSLSQGLENPACDDGLDNDGDGFIDAADPQCTQPYLGSEATPSCGLLGAELLLAFAGWRAWRRRSCREIHA